MEAIGRAVPGFARGGRGSVLSFLSGKEKKEPEKRNLNGGMHGSRRTGRTRLCARRKGAAFFLFFRERSERTKEKKP